MPTVRFGPAPDLVDRLLEEWLGSIRPRAGCSAHRGTSRRGVRGWRASTRVTLARTAPGALQAAPDLMETPLAQSFSVAVFGRIYKARGIGLGHPNSGLLSHPTTIRWSSSGGSCGAHTGFLWLRTFHRSSCLGLSHRRPCFPSPCEGHPAAPTFQSSHSRDFGPYVTNQVTRSGYATSSLAPSH